MTLLREGAVVWPKELFARAMREMKKSAASIFEATSDLAGALRHAPACVSTFSHVTTSAHMPDTHNTSLMDVCQQAGDCVINPTPGFKYHPPAQPVDVTSSIMLNHAEDDALPDRRGGQHYESCEEDSGFGDCSGDNTSEGRVSLEICEELPTRRLPVRLPTRGPLWRGQQEGSSQKENPSRRSLQQTLEEEMQTWCQQTPLRTLQLKLACLQSRQTHLLRAYLKLTSLQRQQTPLQ